MGIVESSKTARTCRLIDRACLYVVRFTFSSYGRILISASLAIVGIHSSVAVYILLPFHVNPTQRFLSEPLLFKTKLLPTTLTIYSSESSMLSNTFKNWGLEFLAFPITQLTSMRSSLFLVLSLDCFIRSLSAALVSRHGTCDVDVVDNQVCTGQSQGQCCPDANTLPYPVFSGNLRPSEPLGDFKLSQLPLWLRQLPCL
jgi:hypothetical protein